MQTKGEGLALYTPRELRILTDQTPWRAFRNHPPYLYEVHARLEKLMAEEQFWHVIKWRPHAENSDSPGYDELRLESNSPPLRPYNKPQFLGLDLPWGGQPGLDLMAIWQANVRRSLLKPAGGTIPALRYLDLSQLFLTFTDFKPVLIRPHMLVSGSANNPIVVEDPRHTAVVELYKKA